MKQQLRSLNEFLVMLTLAVDTSGHNGSLALVRPEGTIATRRLELGVHHGQSLIPEVHALLQEQGLAPAQIELVAVSIGPGSFTGLRVGIVFAKTFAYAVGCRVAAVGTFDAIAEAVPREVSGDELHLIADAQRGDVFLQVFRRENDGWTGAGPISIVPATAWAAGPVEKALVGGPGLMKLRSQIPTGHVLPENLWNPQAESVARIGLHRASQGAFADLWTLEPLYLRRSSAEVQWEALGRK